MTGLIYLMSSKFRTGKASANLFGMRRELFIRVLLHGSHRRCGKAEAWTAIVRGNLSLVSCAGFIREDPAVTR